MKSCFYIINIFLFFIVIPFGNTISLLDLNYPSAISLLNKNVFIVEQEGIFVYDAQLKNIIYSYPFKDANDKISDYNKLSKVVIKFKANYIICLINGKIYFFDQEGKKLLLETKVIPTEENYYYPALIPITALNEQNNYFYVIAYFINTYGSNYKQKLKLYKINTYIKTNDFIKELIINNMENIIFSSTYNFLNKGLSCEYMQNNNEHYLVCFFIINYDNNEFALSNNYFEITSNSINLSNKLNSTFLEKITDVVQIQSLSKEDRKISFVCLHFFNGNLECYEFHFVQDSIDTPELYNATVTMFNCKNVIYGVKLNYLLDGETISLSCIQFNDNIQVKLFNQSFEEINNFTQFNQCESIQPFFGHSIIKLDSGYYIISDIRCDNLKRCVEPLEGDLSPNEIVPCGDLKKCKICSQESMNKKLCIQCNEEKNYYYLNIYPYKEREEFIDCINITQKPSMYYFNTKNSDYEPCYTTCATCEYGGNSEENNCTSCDGINYIKNPDEYNSTNCVVKCQYFYYIERNIYLCTEIPSCPDEHQYLIKDKSKCINNCKDDQEYKYRYNGICFMECPNNTFDDNDFICKENGTNKCYLTENDFFTTNEIITFNDVVEKLVPKYAYEFNYTNSHVSLYKKGNHTVTIYINSKCISQLELGLPGIDFGSCYEKVKSKYNLINRELIIAIIDVKDSKNKRKIVKYGMFSPLTGEYANSDEICQGKISFIDSIKDKLIKAKVNFEKLEELLNQGIDVFNMSSPFYNDVCFKYNSKKDIALKDRMLEFFPNISLCEEGCELTGLNMTTITAICDCFLNEGKKEDELKNKVLEQAQLGAVGDIISSSNLYVMKCINLLLKIDLIKKAYGAHIILCFIIIEIICTIIYCTKDINLIHTYIKEISNEYINYLMKKASNKNKIFLDINNINDKLPKIYIKNKNNDNTKIEAKLLIKQKTSLVKKDVIQQNKNINNNRKESGEYINIINKKVNNNNFKYGKDKRILYNYKIHNKDESSNSTNRVFNLKSNKDLLKNNNDNFDNIDNIDIGIEKYLETQYEDMQYDDAIIKDKRKFCECYKEKIINNQIIINIFCSNNAIRPRSIKIIFFILQLDLYFFINGLFYDEEYISNIYHLEKDTILTKAERIFQNLIYAVFAGIITNYIIELFFIEENKIKKIFKFNKDKILELKIEINKINKSIKRRYLIFIIISFIIALITFVHISCFNVVYNHIMYEWIIFSCIIILFMQIVTFLICLIRATLRCIGLKCKIEKLYKLSL